MRRGEILNLTWDQVGLKNRVIRPEAEDTKDRERRVVPMPNKLFEILQLNPSRFHGNQICLYNGKQISDIKTGLKAACEKANISYGHKSPGGFVFHDLRHTCNTNMRKAGVDHSVIIKITGHTTEQMFHRYNTVDLEDGQKAVDQLQTYFQNHDQIMTKHQKATTDIASNANTTS
jgi:integrase